MAISKERAVFNRFASVCGIPIDLQSIRDGQPPDPDIPCEMQSGGSLRFELRECVSPQTMHMLAQWRMDEKLQAALNDYPRNSEFRERFSSYVIHLGFYKTLHNEPALPENPRAITETKVLGVAHELFDMMLDSGNRGKERIHPYNPPYPALQTIIGDVYLGPQFDGNPSWFWLPTTIPYHPAESLITDSIQGKLQKRYSIGRLDLLLYFDIQPFNLDRFYETTWEDWLKRYWDRSKSGTQFDRLWLVFLMEGHDSLLFRSEN